MKNWNPALPLLALLLSNLLPLNSSALDKWETSVEHSPSGQFDFYVYALTWQPSYCKINSLTSCPNAFKAHGIWPYFKTPKNSKIQNYHPAYCFASPGCSTFEDCPLDSKTVRFVKENPRLKALRPDAPDTLLQHEWRKHGTCSGLSQIDYFNLLTRFESSLQYGTLLNKLKEKNNQPITRKEVIASLPANTSLWCKNYQGKDYLFEIHFYIDKQGEPFNDSGPQQIGDPCPEKFIAPLY